MHVLHRRDPQRSKTKRSGEMGLSGRVSQTVHSCPPRTVIVISLARCTRLLHACPTAFYRNGVEAAVGGLVPVGLPGNHAKEQGGAVSDGPIFADAVATVVIALLVI